MPERVLVVDDQPNPRRLLCMELVEAGFEVLEAENGEEGWETFCNEAPDAVVTDMAMPRCDGLELLRRIRTRSDVPVIVFSGYGSVESAADAFKAGADDFVSSLDLENEDLVDRLRRTLGPASDSEEGGELEHRLVGPSAAMSRVRSQIEGLAPLSTPVLVSGEPGTGRSTAIRALHELGSTNPGALLQIDAKTFEPPIAANDLPAAVHIEGVEWLSPAAQEYFAGLLAAAEADPSRQSVRVMASTTLPVLPHADHFSPKLAKRLSRFHLDIPPLRYRTEDVPEIAGTLVERIGVSVGRSMMRLSPASIETLQAARLPGNVEQLAHVLERAMAFTRGRVIRKQTLQEAMHDGENSLASIRQQKEAAEHQRLLEAINETGANISQTAELLGKSRAAVYRMIHKYGIPLSRS